MQIDIVVKGYLSLKLVSHQAITVGLDKMVIHSKLLGVHDLLSISVNKTDLYIISNLSFD